MTFIEKVHARARLEYSEKTVLCFVENGTAYAVETEIRDEWVKEAHESSARGGQLKGRISLNALDRAALKNRKTCRVLGALDTIINRYRDRYFEIKGKNAPNNKGWAFECWLTEEAGQEWEPDTVPCWMGADLTVNGTTYQIKSDGAEYFTDSSLANAIAARG